MRQRKTVSRDAGQAMSRRKFLGVTAGATAALSFGTFIRSGQGAASLRILTWSNTLNAMDDTLREQAKQYTKEKGVEVAFEFINQTDLPTKTAAAVESGAGPDIITTWSDGAHLHEYFTRTRAIRRGIIEAGQDTAAPDFGRQSGATTEQGQAD
jgi:ABC-type glycerol-3-phosphate transport system substrate-binding protein